MGLSFPNRKSGLLEFFCRLEHHIDLSHTHGVFKTLIFVLKKSMNKISSGDLMYIMITIVNNTVIYCILEIC